MDTPLSVASPIPQRTSPPAGRPAAAGGEGGFGAELLRAAGSVPEADPAEAAALPAAEPQSDQTPEEADKTGQAEAPPPGRLDPMPVAAAVPQPADPPPAILPHLATGGIVASGASQPQTVASAAEASGARPGGTAPRPVAAGRIVIASPTEGANQVIRGEAGSEAAARSGMPATTDGITAAQSAQDGAAAARDSVARISGLEPATAMRMRTSGIAGGDPVPASPPQRLDAVSPDALCVEASGTAQPSDPAQPVPDHAGRTLAETPLPLGGAVPSTGAAPAPPASEIATPQAAQGLALAPAAPPPPVEASAPPSPSRLAPALPVRQLAPVCIALAIGPGQAPRLTVALEPEELGRVEIRVEHDAEGDAATVQVTAARPETLALLQRDARELDRALQQAGIPLGEGALRFGLSGQDQPGGQGGGGGRSRRGPASPDRSPDPPIRPPAAALSLLDIAI